MTLTHGRAKEADSISLNVIVIICLLYAPAAGDGEWLLHDSVQQGDATESVV